MGPTTVTTRRVAGARAFVALFGLLLVALGLFATATPAAADEDDPYRISGNVQLDGEPLEGVVLVIDGPGDEQQLDTHHIPRSPVRVP